MSVVSAPGSGTMTVSTKSPPRDDSSMLTSRPSSTRVASRSDRTLGVQVSSTIAVTWDPVVVGCSAIQALPWSRSDFQRVATAVADSPRMRPASVQLMRGASCKRWIRARSTSSSGRVMAAR